MIISMRKVPRIQRICECGNGFETTQWRIDHDRGKFCSSSCAHRHIFTENNPRKTDPIILICEQCGTEYLPYRKAYAKDSPSGRPAQRFCSHECSHAFYSGKNNGNYKDPVMRVCVICGKVFKIKPAQVGVIPYRCCSLECMGKYRIREGLAKGKNNPGYVHGNRHLPYTEDFKLAVRPACLERYGLTQECPDCCHHIDYDKTNNDFMNLIPLSRSIHSLTGQKKFREQWYVFLTRLNFIFYFINGKSGKFV